MEASMHFSPRPYQQLAIDKMVAQPYQLLALRMGTGKTPISLSAIAKLLERGETSKVLVVAPLRVAELVWHTEAAKWDHTKGLRVQRVLGTAKERMAALACEADIFVINRENLPWLVELVGVSKQPWPFDLVVLDETTGFKDRSSKAWKSIKSVRNSIKRLYLLTGTPDPQGDLLAMWPQISLMDKGQRLGTGITKYKDRWYLPDKRNGPIIYSYKLKDGAREEIYGLISDVMLSIESDIVLPERIDNVVEVVFPMKRYRELANEMITGEVTASNAAVLAGKLGQMANGAVYDDTGEVHHIHDAKLDALAEIVEQGEQVLVFTTYRHDQARIKAKFLQAEVFDGAQSMARWASGECQLMLMHPASGGHGVDGLQLSGHVCVWFGLPFNLDLYEQATARLHRTGQTVGVVVHHLVAKHTIDERIMQVLATKGDMQQALLDAVKEVA
jgi:SNF2 family DNA or RNA helicase